MNPFWRIFFVLAIFSIAMGFLEAAVVIYLRELYYPEGFKFPLSPIPPAIAGIELLREAGSHHHAACHRYHRRKECCTKVLFLYLLLWCMGYFLLYLFKALFRLARFTIYVGHTISYSCTMDWSRNRSVYFINEYDSAYITHRLLLSIRSPGFYQ